MAHGMMARRPAPERVATPGRARLIDQLRAQGISNERVLQVMAQVPRHEFVEAALAAQAYQCDVTLPIGHQQTLSQPRIVALMTEVLLAANPKPLRLLEVGTGSGYQTAVLAAVCDTVFSVERIRALSESARARLARLGIKNAHCGYADGSDGWLAFAPYDGILVTAGAEAVSNGMLAQLSVGGVLVVPVGPPGQQQLLRIQRTATGYQQNAVAHVSFVPLLPGKQ